MTHFTTCCSQSWIADSTLANYRIHDTGLFANDRGFSHKNVVEMRTI